ncbi:MAG: hypothetical protein ACSLFQ_16765 [Thermoanaerobaculia bacterium]
MLPLIAYFVFGLGMSASIWFLVRTNRRHRLGVITQIGWAFFSFVFWSTVAFVVLVATRER